jgi:hypothetical protein
MLIYKAEARVLIFSMREEAHLRDSRAASGRRRLCDEGECTARVGRRANWKCCAGLRETQHRSPQGYGAGGRNPRQTDVLLEQ